jgi:hypothetical protein
MSARRLTAPPPVAPAPAYSRTEQAARMVGKIATFTPTPESSTRAAGAITAARYIGEAGPGKIPDFELTLQGRTGRTATVSMFHTRATLFDSWGEALSSP